MNKKNSSEKWSYGYTPEQKKRFTLHAILFLVMFSVLYCTLYCMRQNITLGGQYLELPVEEGGLGWNKGTIGIMTSVLFWTYGIGHLINGRLSERFGPHKFIIGAIVLSFGANMLMGLTGFLPPMPDIFGISSLVLIMALIWGLNGYFQSMAWSSGLAVLTNWWPSDRRGFAVGFTHAFSGLGGTVATIAVAVSMTVAAKLDLNLGWQAIFFLPAILPAIMLIVYLLCSRPSPERVGLPPYQEKSVQKNEEEEHMKAIVREKGTLYPYFHLLSNPKFLIFVFVTFLCGVARYGLTQWIPYYFTAEYGIDIEASLFGSLALSVGMAVGTFVVPVITDKLCPTNRMPAVIISALLAAAAIVGFLPLDPKVPGQLVLIQVLLFIAGFGIYAVDGIAFTYATDVGGRVFSGTASGILDFSAYMGAAIQSIVYGFIFDLNHTIIFYTIVAFCAVNAALAFIGSRKKKQA